MPRTIEAIVDEDGNVSLLESVKIPSARRAFLIILDEGPEPIIPDAALLSEPALAEDWNRSEEDEAWSHLQSDQ